MTTMYNLMDDEEDILDTLEEGPFSGVVEELPETLEEAQGMLEEMVDYTDIDLLKYLGEVATGNYDYMEEELNEFWYDYYDYEEEYYDEDYYYDY